MNDWIERINNVNDICEMEELVEEIAFDDNLTNDEYEAFVNMALNRVR